MTKRIHKAILSRLSRFIKSIYYFFRIIFYPFKTISGITIPLKQSWAYTVKDHIIRGDYETGEYAIISQTLETTDRVLEIGTGLGFLAIYCSKIVGQQNVTSIEANHFLRDYHQQIFKINGIYPNVIYKAVDITERKLTFYIDKKNFGHHHYIRLNQITFKG